MLCSCMGGMGIGGGSSSDGTGDVSNVKNAVPPDHIPAASACTSQAPAPRVLRRLTQAELNATIKDLLGQNAQAPQTQGLFADDTVAYGFRDIEYNLTVHGTGALQVQTFAEQVASFAATQVSLASPCSTVDPTCQQNFINTFGKKAFRRPLQPEETQAYLQLTKDAKDFPTVLQTVVSAMLQSPFFLYRSELGTKADGGALTPYEIASELSYLIIGSMPDDALMKAADTGALASAPQIAEQAKRLLKDPRAHGVVDEFFVQWLGVSELPNQARVEGSATLSPEVKVAMLQETRAFVDDLVFTKNGTYADLLTAPYTFINPTLAQHYGMPMPQGAAGTALALASTQDGSRMPGVLGQGSVMSANAQTTYASPTLRGRMVRMRMLCNSVPTPPPGVPQLEGATPTQTTRQRFEQHATNATCAACHKLMDPLGYTFGGFDTLGRKRPSNQENGVTVDTTGNVADVNTGDVTPVADAAALGSELSKNATAQACLARHWSMYAYGQLSWSEDACTFDAVAKSAAASGFNLQQVIVSLTQAESFSQRARDP